MAVSIDVRNQDAQAVVPDVFPVVAALAQVRQAWRESQGRPTELRGRELPSVHVLERVVEELRGALFPMRLGPAELCQENEDFYVGHTLDSALRSLAAQIRLELLYVARHQSGVVAGEVESRVARILADFAAALPHIRRLLDSDVVAAFEGDPAARSVDEVLLSYPGIQAMINHRLAHQLYVLGVPMLARLIAELAHSKTGIDIHPGAHIGPGLFIDHGTGVVIGETTVIGQKVRIYQAVTLGAKSFPTDAEGHAIKGLPRHPKVEDEVVIYAGATVLGRVTLGRGAVIGGNVWVTHDVAPGTHVTQARSRRDGEDG